MLKRGWWWLHVLFWAKVHQLNSSQVLLLCPQQTNPLWSALSMSLPLSQTERVCLNGRFKDAELLVLLSEMAFLTHVCSANKRTAWVCFVTLGKHHHLLFKNRPTRGAPRQSLVEKVIDCLDLFYKGWPLYKSKSQLFFFCLFGTPGW